MTAPAASRAPAGPGSRSPRHRVLAGCAGLNAVSAWYGVAGLVGGWLSFGAAFVVAGRRLARRAT
ncbi:MAG: hypothetical protein KDB35_19165 [Acidimicrobiales bacterium]|nr:hypothetical protein [Acidimicrobiales bacterium]MCB1014356.1 hypothetical protein [Acidimicrobiales bacterium]MCB9371803.1 hypothetical protein [Microthrixaceae bacterium]